MIAQDKGHLQIARLLRPHTHSKTECTLIITHSKLQRVVYNWQYVTGNHWKIEHSPLLVAAGVTSGAVGGQAAAGTVAAAAAGARYLGRREGLLRAGHGGRCGGGCRQARRPHRLRRRGGRLQVSGVCFLGGMLCCLTPAVSQEDFVRLSVAGLCPAVLHTLLANASASASACS